MSAIRKVVLSVSALFLAFSGLFLANVTATANSHVTAGSCPDGQEWNCA